MKNIAKILPYFLVENLLVNEEKATTCHIKSVDGFKTRLNKVLKFSCGRYFQERLFVNLNMHYYKHNMKT